MAPTDMSGDTWAADWSGVTPADPESPPRLAAWELVERGRYRPIRTRGSFPGRELG
jgi:hypothetical protein